MLTTYTSHDEVRAVLGVSVKDLDDSTLALPLYERNLTLEFAEVDTTLKSSYATIAGLPEGSRTAAEQTFYEVVQVYSAYSISRQLLTSLPYFALQRVTDGRAEGERENEAFKDVKDSINATFNILAARLRTYYSALGNSLTARETRIHAVATGLASDPVTG